MTHFIHVLHSKICLLSVFLLLIFHLHGIEEVVLPPGHKATGLLEYRLGEEQEEQEQDNHNEEKKELRKVKRDAGNGILNT